MAKLVRKTPSLKSQGAKYSVTNRKGETSYYASSKDVDAGKAPISKSGGKESPTDTLGRAQAMVAQTQAEGSKPFAGSSFEKNYLAGIPAVSSQEGPINIPRPTVTDVGDVVGTGMSGIASLLGEKYTYTDGKLTPVPQQKDGMRSLYDEANFLEQRAFDEMGTGEERMRRLEREADLRQKEEAVTQFTSQLNQIVAERDANMLRVEGQGRGIPDVIIGGQQAQINKEAAIAALPVQAQLAAAQGALEMAENYVTKMFQIQSQDALATYQFRSKLIDSAYNFATAQEQRRLDAIKAKEDREYAEKQDFLVTKRNLLSSALGQGASSAVINRINSATNAEEAINAAGAYNADILARQVQQANLRSASANAALNEFQLSAAKDAEIARQEAIASGRLLPEQAEVADSIDKEFRGEQVVKDYNTAVAKRGAALDIINNGVSGVQDLLLVYEFMKSVDPTSVVRESEFDNASKSGNIFAGQWTKFNKGYFGEGGFLPPDVKNSFMGALNASYNTKTNQYMNVKNEFGEKINNRLGVNNGTDYLTDYENAAPTEETKFGLPMNDNSADPLGILSPIKTSTYSGASW